jgi:hypothetical protein
MAEACRRHTRPYRWSEARHPAAAYPSSSDRNNISNNSNVLDREGAASIKIVVLKRERGRRIGRREPEMM